MFLFMFMMLHIITYYILYIKIKVFIVQIYTFSLYKFSVIFSAYGYDLRDMLQECSFQGKECNPG